MTDEAFLDDLATWMHVDPDCHIYEKCTEQDPALDMDDAKTVYRTVLTHLLYNVVSPKDSARGIIFALQKRLKELEA